MTNHMRVVIAVADRPRQSLSDIAAQTGIEVRHVRRLLGELEASGYVSRRRNERPHLYTVHVDERVRQRGVSGTVGDILAAVRGER